MNRINEVEYFDKVIEAYRKIDFTIVNKVLDLLESSAHERKRIFIFGNGGSGAFASHFCEDLGKGTITDYENGPRFRVISLADNTPYILAWANDNGYEMVFEQQLRNLAEPADIAVAISGSGNSDNVLRAVDYANAHGLYSVGFTGFDGGKLAGMVKSNIHVPCDDMGIVEGVHGVLSHYMVDELRERLR